MKEQDKNTKIAPKIIKTREQFKIKKIIYGATKSDKKFKIRQ